VPLKPHQIRYCADRRDLEERAEHIQQVLSAVLLYVDVIVRDTASVAPGGSIAHHAAMEKEGECAQALLDIRPTTLEGLLALLRYAEKADAGRDWPDEIASAAAEALEAIERGESVEETESGVSEFGDAYAEWLDARASVAKLNCKGYALPDVENPDAVMDRTIGRVRAAEHRLAFVPAILSYQLVEKFEALAAMMSDRERDGRPNDNRHMLMLASVKGDLYRFRFNLQGDHD
jgi:hypothetical protein